MSHTGRGSLILSAWRADVHQADIDREGGEDTYSGVYVPVKAKTRQRPKRAGVCASRRLRSMPCFELDSKR